MTSNSVTNYGTLLKRENNPVGTGTYSVVAEVLTIEPPEVVTEALEATHLSSGGKREWKPSGLIDFGEVTFGMHYVSSGTAATPASATDFWQDLNAHTIRGYQIDFPVDFTAPTGTYVPPTWQFNGQVISFKPSDVDGQDPQLADVEIKLKVSNSLLLV